jgi:hypothetical protein
MAMNGEKILEYDLDITSVIDYGAEMDEPYRLSARANSLRGYVHGPTESVFP